MKPARVLPSPFRVVADPALSPEENAAVGGGGTAANFAIYPPFSTPSTELFWAKVYEGERLVAIVPVVKLRKRKATDMLRHGMRRWLGPTIGPLARKTTLLVDTAFMAYDDQSPFITAPGVDRLAIKRAVSAFLKSQKKVDSVWISEPAADAEWAAAEGYQQFHTLPMAVVETAQFSTIDQYLATLSKKRRRNIRHERETFAAAGATIRRYDPPLDADPELMRKLLDCLESSKAHTQFAVPYNDVLAADETIRAQRNTLALVAEIEGEVIAFMSLLHAGDRLMQCHGGLDHGKSHEALAYHNLIAAAIELGIERRCRVVSFGPLTNETKRRAVSQLRPIVSSLWNKLPGDRIVAKMLFVKNFEVYRGELGAEIGATNVD